MTFCKQMWSILRRQLAGEPKHGINATQHWGNVYLLREARVKRKKVIYNKHGDAIPMDGHVAYLHDPSESTVQGDARLQAVAIRCWGWDGGFSGDRGVDMREVITGAEMNAAATVHEDEAVSGRLVEPPVQDMSDMRHLLLNCKWYQGLSDEEIIRFAAEGMIRHPEKQDYVTCHFHSKNGRYLEFQSASSIRCHFTKVGFHKGCHIQEPVRQPPPPVVIPVTEKTGVWATMSDSSDEEAEMQAATRDAPSRSRSPRVDLLTMSACTQKWVAALVDCFFVVEKRHRTWDRSIEDIFPYPHNCFRSPASGLVSMDMRFLHC